MTARKYRNAAERAEAKRRQNREWAQRNRAKRKGSRLQAVTAKAATEARAARSGSGVQDLGGGADCSAWTSEGPAKFKLLPWQLEFAGIVFDPDVQTALLSIARKCGKSSLLGLLLGSKLDPASPLYGGPTWRGLAITINARLAGILRRYRDADSRLKQFAVSGSEGQPSAD